MKTILALALAATAITAMPATAQTTTLTFNSLVRQYGDGFSYGDGTTGNGQTLTYSEGSYILTLFTTNPVGTFGAHIGDASFVGQNNFNWHDDGDNLVGAYVTLSRVGGGLFNLTSFDYGTVSGTGLTATAGANSPLIFAANTSGTSTPGFTNVSSVRFDSTGYTFNRLDNIQVTAVSGPVPEPATWGMMLVGFGMMGFGMRRHKSTVRTSVRFA